MFSDINLKYGIKLRKDPIAVFFHRWFWAVHLVYAVGIFLVYPYGIISLYLAPAGLTWAGGAIQNIYSHLLGAQPNNTGDNSRNNWFNVIAGFGEGWHNNHHANPGQYRFGPFDPAARLIEWLDPSKKH
jgi:stearoyl-CoA desaturase (delta-9 desaturase)